MASNEKTFSDSNPQYEPLNTKQIKVFSKNGIDTTVPAIHIGFMETRFYVHFKMPPSEDNINNPLTPQEEEWLEYMIFMEEDLHWLLKLPHQRFWCQVVYDENLHRCLESYLSQAPRTYDVDSLNLKEELHSALKKIHKLVFLCYLRMSTYKESKMHHISPKAFGEVIYDNFIFDIPKIMDLCALYGFQNSTLLSKMIQNIFSTQLKYKDDLDETAKDILSRAFNSIEEKLLTISSAHCDSDSEKEISSFYDLVNYITDVSITIHSFLENYPPACEVFHQNGALIRIPTFYEQVFPILEKEIAKKEGMENKSLLEKLTKKTTLSKTSLMRVFRNILNYTCLQNILNCKMSNMNEKVCASSLVDSYFEVIMEFTCNRNFLSDYNLLYPFDADLELFNELEIDVDSERVNYIFHSIHDISEISSETFTSAAVNGARPKIKTQPESINKPVHNIQSLVDILRPKNLENSCKPEEISHNGESSSQNEVPKLTEIEIDSLIQSVLDVGIPSYGEGFVQKCLEFYSYDSERVIDALLTDTFPESLDCLDRNLERLPKNVAENESYPILSERKSIFDNDEFDMFSRNDVNMANVHIGKKNKTPTSYETLQNDEESEFIKQLTLTYGYDDEESESKINIYEDEYDDTYDSSMVGLKEPAPEDEPESDSDEEETIQQKPGDFHINPEIIRERAAQRRQARGGYNKNYKDREEPRSTDPSHNRQQKDRHKSHIGNHNRRKQADYKKSRGMMPFPSR